MTELCTALCKLLSTCFVVVTKRTTGFLNSSPSVKS